MNTTPKQTALALLRITMGINLLGHGLVRIPKISGFRDWMVTQFGNSILPEWTIYSWASILPFIELSIGILLILGLFTYRASIVGAIVIAVLIFGSCLIENWEWAGAQMVYALFFYFIISNVHNNTWEIDKYKTK